MTDGHREETTKYFYGQNGVSGEVRDKYDGGFSVNWAVELKPDTRTRREWSRNGSGASSGFLTGTTTRTIAGALTSGTVSTGWTEAHIVTTKQSAFDAWSRPGAAGDQLVQQELMDSTNDSVTAGYTFVGSPGMWQETRREQHLDHKTQIDEGYTLNRQTWTDAPGAPPGTNWQSGIAGMGETITASSTRKDWSKVDRTRTSGTFSYGHDYTSWRRSGYDSRTALTPAGESGSGNGWTSVLVDDEKEVRGEVVNGADQVTWWRYFQESQTNGHTFSERHGPTYDWEGTTDSENIHYRYWAEGSPASGTRRILSEGMYRTWTLYEPQVGSPQENNTSSPAGTGVEQVTTWPMQGPWTENVMVVGVWQLTREGAA